MLIGGEYVLLTTLGCFADDNLVAILHADGESQKSGGRTDERNEYRGV
jgi:hypothetical protein